jgi:hypothetical protein
MKKRIRLLTSVVTNAIVSAGISKVNIARAYLRGCIVGATVFAITKYIIVAPSSAQRSRVSCGAPSCITYLAETKTIWLLEDMTVLYARSSYEAKAW